VCDDDLHAAVRHSNAAANSHAEVRTKVLSICRAACAE
jgi:hypothetical protein